MTCHMAHIQVNHPATQSESIAMRSNQATLFVLETALANSALKQLISNMNFSVTQLVSVYNINSIIYI